MATLSRIGAAAAAAKRPWALRTPDSSVTSTMNIRYGKVIRVSVTASANRSGVAGKPGASSVTSCGMKAIASPVRTVRTATSSTVSPPARRCAAGAPRCSSTVV